MSKHQALQHAFNALPPEDLLKLTIGLRDTYVERVRNTEEELDPKQLRSINASIERLQKAINKEG